MKIFNRIVTFFYTLIFIIIGCLLIAFSLHLKQLWDLSEISVFIQQAVPNLWLIALVAGFLLIVMSISVARVSLAKFQREKTIAFTTPDGQVTISLTAIEDFIKRATLQIGEIKELKSNVVAGRRGIEISARVTLWSDANIPETTEKLQSLIKGRVQDMLGIEETISVKVHVVKIAPKEAPREKKGEPAVPFRGMEYRGA